MVEGLGSSPIGFEQKENLLKMEDERKQGQANNNEWNRPIKEYVQLNYLLLL